MKIELLHVSECPHVDAARALLRECLAELKLDVTVDYKEGAYPSPTILVNGIDVMGAPAFQAAACRLDVPTKQRLLVALRTRDHSQRATAPDRRHRHRGPGRSGTRLLGARRAAAHISVIHGQVRFGFDPLSAAIGLVGFPAVVLAWQ